MPNYPHAPDWKFGDILQSDYDPLPKQTIMFIIWTYRVDHNPTESVFYGLWVSPDDGGNRTGQIIRADCGWWKLHEAREAQ